jgi:hypothetical protein
LQRPAFDFPTCQSGLLVQSVLHTRIKLITEQENPSLSFQPVFAWAEKEEGKSATTRDIFEILKDALIE